VAAGTLAFVTTLALPPVTFYAIIGGLAGIYTLHATGTVLPGSFSIFVVIHNSVAPVGSAALVSASVMELLKQNIDRSAYRTFHNPKPKRRAKETLPFCAYR